MDENLSTVKEESDNGVNDVEIKTEPIEDEGEIRKYGFCEPCQGEGVIMKAEGKCKECEESMCTTCFRHHRKAKPCRYHSMVGDTTKPPVSEESETWRNCKYHTAEKIQFYCYSHETIGCRECMAVLHKRCKTEVIKNLSTNFQDNGIYKSLLGKLSDLGKAFKESEKKISDSKADTERMHEQAYDEIIGLKKDIGNYLYIEEKYSFSELEKLSCSNSKELENLERDNMAVVSKIERLTQKLDTNIYQGDALFINFVKCKLYIPGLEKTLAKIKSGENVKKYRFVPNGELSKIIDQDLHLGHFEISDSNNIPPCEQVHEEKSVAPKSGRTTNHVEKNDSMKRGKKRKRNETRQLSAVKATVGARVRPGPCFTYDWDHRNKPGTVTSLEADGTVTVEWDATGKSWSGYRVGAVWNGVELI